MVEIHKAEKEPTQGSPSAQDNPTCKLTDDTSIPNAGQAVNKEAMIGSADTPSGGAQVTTAPSAGQPPNGNASQGGKSKAPKKPITIDDVKAILTQMRITIRYNVISGLPEIKGMPPEYSSENAANILPIIVGDALKKNGHPASRQTIDDALNAIMDENRFNPVREKVISAPYTQMDYIVVLDQILGITHDGFSQILLRKWLHQSIAMAFNDDLDPFGADGVLVLQGEQGEGKTYFFHTLAGTADLFAEGVSIDLNNKDSIIQSTGVWVAELGELDSTLKRDQSSLKAFLTSRRDTYRVPYGRTYIRKPRRTSFCATVNPSEFLIDETGSRRFWVIHVPQIDLLKLKSLTPDWVWELWRQVLEELYLPDPQGFRLTPDERKELNARNHAYEKPLPGEIDVLSGLRMDIDHAKWVWCSASDVINVLDLHGLSSVQVGRVLSKLEKQYQKIQKRIVHGCSQYLLPIR